MSWLDRQSFLGPGSSRTLASITAGIAGLGGGGSHVAQQLAHVGVGNFVLMDEDVIDKTNLNRLVGGTRADIAAGARKVDIAARMILAVNPQAKVEVVHRKWQEAVDDLRHCDVVLGSVDNVRGKDELEAFCRRLLIPYIDQGMDVHEVGAGFLIAGQVVLSMPGGPCLRCLGVVTDEALDEEGRNYGAAGGKPQVVWPNGVLASTAVGLFMRVVTPWYQSELVGDCLEYDGNTATVQRSDRMLRRALQECPHQPLADLGDPSFDIRRVAQRDASPTTRVVAKEVSASPWWMPVSWKGKGLIARLANPTVQGSVVASDHRRRPRTD